MGPAVALPLLPTELTLLLALDWVLTIGAPAELPLRLFLLTRPPSALWGKAWSSIGELGTLPVGLPLGEK
jgi:hypothetical protein